MDNAVFPSPPSDGFPTGLRVLVVDDDLTWLKIIEKMLKKCLYEVTTCCLAREALNILREQKDGFDIVISDVNMPDMDGFKLLELVGLEMDLPVIMMSVDGETSRVMKGVQHGACDYLLKPIRMKELRNIWQHVLRKRINNVQNYDEAIQLIRVGSAQSQFDAGCYNVTDVSSTRKRKDICSAELSDAFAKRARVVWTVDLHQKFVKAVKLIGIEKIGPKKILDSMNVPWLTRENVASHLQKYRLYLSRLQKDNGDKPFEISDHLDVDFCIVKHSEFFSNDEPEEICFGTRETHNDNHMDADKGASSENMYYNCDIQVKGSKSRKLMLPVLKTELNSGLYADAPEAQNKKIHHSESGKSDVQFAVPEANIIPKFSWNEGISVEHCYEKDRMSPVIMEPDPSIDHLNPSVSANVVKSHLKREIYPPYADQVTRIDGKAPLEHKFETTLNDPYTSGVQLQTQVCPGPEPIIHELIQKYKSRFERREDSELALVAFGKDYKTEWDQNDQGLYDFHDSNETDLMASVPDHLFDAWRYDWCSEALGSGCPIMMDQSISIVDNAHFSSSYYPVS